MNRFCHIAYYVIFGECWFLDAEGCCQEQRIYMPFHFAQNIAAKYHGQICIEKNGVGELYQG